jgi:hypothetical protein
MLSTNTPANRTTSHVMAIAAAHRISQDVRRGTRPVSIALTSSGDPGACSFGGFGRPSRIAFTKQSVEDCG